MTVPPSRNAGRSRASASSEVSARGCSSRVTTTGSPLRCGIVHGDDLAVEPAAGDGRNGPVLAARANSSWSSRATAQRSATFSRCLAHRGRVALSASRGLRNRQPSVVSWSSWLPRSKPASGLRRTYGARVIDSTPPAMKTSPSPNAIAWAAELIACRPQPHRRLTVWPGDLDGEAGEQERHARDVAVVLARLVRAAEDDVFDEGWVDARSDR